jgi:hypothetical protein
MALTACFARKVALWFERDGAEQVADPVRLRQMNMAIALAASRWNEFSLEPDAEPRMNATRWSGARWCAEPRRGPRRSGTPVAGSGSASALRSGHEES